MISAAKLKINDLLESSGLKETFLHAKNYLLTSILTQGISLISIPVFTYLLTTSDYGILNLFSTYVQIFAILLPLNLYTSVSRYFYEEKDDFNSFLGTSILVSLICMGIGLATIVVFRDYFADLLQLPPETIAFFIPAVAMAVIDSIFMQIFMPRRDSKKILRLSTAQSYIGFLISVVIVYMMKENRYIGRLWADLVIFLIFGSFKIYQFSSFFKLTLNRKYLRYIFSYSLPLIPYLLSGVILSQFDRIMINSYKGAADTGLYSFAYNLSMLQVMVSNALYNAWMPEYFKYLNEGKYEEHDRDVLKLFNLISLSAFFFILFGSEIGMLLSSKSYHSALPLIPIVIIGHWFVAIFPVYGRNIQYKKKTYLAAIITLMAGVLNIYLNTLFIPRYGSMAAAYTTTISQLFLCIAAFLISKYLIRLHTVQPVIFLKSFVLLILVVIAFYMLERVESFYLLLILKIVLLGVTSAILYSPSVIKYIQLKHNSSHGSN